MRRLGIVLTSLVVLTVSPARAQEPSNTLSEQESRQGWILLFDGKSLDGWESRPTTNQEGDQTGNQPDWTVKNGALVCGGTVPSWIGTTRIFSDYHLKLEFRGPEKVNSGVFLRSQKEGAPHRTGYELQIWDYQPAGYNTGSLVGSLKAPATKILPDQWNSYDITVRGGHFVIVLNGTTLLDVHDSAHASGVVGFQCQRDNRIEFRNIKLLPAK